MWRVLVAAAALGGALPAPPAAPCAALCTCRGDHLACDAVPFHRFPATDATVRHVAVSAARLGELPEAALDGRALRTLVIVNSHLHYIEPRALASMTSTLASLDLGHNEFTEVPLEALRDLKVLNWLNLQNNRIGELEPGVEWGALGESLSSLSLGNNQLCALADGALAALRGLAQLDLEGNRLHTVAADALPPSLALLRLSDNLLAALPCAALARLPRLRHLHLRDNSLRPSPDRSCRANASRVDSLDLAQNELDDLFTLEIQERPQLKRLALDLNDFSAIPAFALDGGRLERLSMSHNRLSRVSDAALHALRELRRLELEHNELAALGAGLAALYQLRHLALAHNRLTELPHLPPRLRSLALAGNLLERLPAGLRALEPASLLHLDVGYNRIKTLVATDFGPWAEALATLGLRGNRIVALRANAFPAGLPLRELALSFGDLAEIEAGALANLSQLQVLELSTTPLVELPTPAELPALSWLSLDNSDVRHVTAERLRDFATLEYLNLEFNKIVEFPSDASAMIGRPAADYRLRELRLSYNHISDVNAEFLTVLSRLQSIDLSYNRLRSVGVLGFAKMPELAYLNLAGNLVEEVAPCAFFGLPRLQALDLHDNRIRALSPRYFENVSSSELALTVNVSRNRITELTGGEAPAAFIEVLDLSYNLLESLPRMFFEPLASHLRRLTLSHNRLVTVDGGSFGLLPNLLVLSLDDNRLEVAKRRAFADMPALRTLDLSRNQLRRLAPEQFLGLRHLRHLRLDGNELRALPPDCFRNTVVEHLDLADNMLTVFPGSALALVGFTLRRLELARNRIEHLDAAMFRTAAFLHELGLAGNALTALADNALAAVPRLRRLDLSGNRLKANFKELFGGVPRLRALALAEAGLRAVPALPLPDLTELELAGNAVASFREADVRWLRGLRTLGLARNRLTALQPAMWTALPHLATLDLSANPIVRVSRGAFEGLSRLQRLRLERLPRLEAVEPRAFRPLAALRALYLESPLAQAAVDGGAPLAAVLAETRAIEALTLTVRSRALDAQLRGVVAPRLRALEVRGTALHHVATHAFAALGRQRALALRLRGTGVTALPAGLTRPLARVPHLALDFTDNRLASFSPATLYPNLTGWGQRATALLPGGLVVAERQLACGCGAAWVGAWLRRWTAEVGGWSRGAGTAARVSRCGAAARPLLALAAAPCPASALASRAPHRTPPALLWLVLLYSLS